MSNVLYSLEQGIKSPRDGSINWIGHDTYETLAAAKKEVRSHKGRWRVIETKVVWQKEPEAS